MLPELRREVSIRRRGAARRLDRDDGGDGDDAGRGRGTHERAAERRAADDTAGRESGEPKRPFPTHCRPWEGSLRGGLVDASLRPKWVGSCLASNTKGNSSETKAPGWVYPNKHTELRLTPPFKGPPARAKCSSPDLPGAPLQPLKKLGH